MMATANVWAQESYCERAKVGAVLSNENRIVSCGYNGTVSKSGNCCEEESKDEFIEKTALIPNNVTDAELKLIIGEENLIEINRDSFKYTYKIPSTKTVQEVVHAEVNVLMFAAKNGMKTDGCTMYITLAPCIECSKLMIQAGIKEVVYESEYRITDGIDFLDKHGVVVRKLEV